MEAVGWNKVEATTDTILGDLFSPRYFVDSQLQGNNWGSKPCELQNVLNLYGLQWEWRAPISCPIRCLPPYMFSTYLSVNSVGKPSQQTQSTAAEKILLDLRGMAFKILPMKY